MALGDNSMICDEKNNAPRTAATPVFLSAKGCFTGKNERETLEGSSLFQYLLQQQMGWSSVPSPLRTAWRGGMRVGKAGRITTRKLFGCSLPPFSCVPVGQAGSFAEEYLSGVVVGF